MSNTTYNGTHFHVLCDYCGHQNEEPQSPIKNPHPWQFRGERCTGCQETIQVDWDVIMEGQAAFQK